MQHSIATQASRELRVSASNTTVSVSLRVDEAGSSWHHGKLVDLDGEVRVSAHDGLRHLFFLIDRGGSLRIRLFSCFDEDTAASALSLAGAALGELLPDSVFLARIQLVKASEIAAASSEVEVEIAVDAPAAARS